MPLLKIENFKCYKKSSVEFDDLTVLVGSNGAGKSSVIQAMLMLREAVFSNGGDNLPINNFKGQNLGQGIDIFHNNDTSKPIKLTWSDSTPSKPSRVSLDITDSDAMLDLRITHRSRGLNNLTSSEFHFLTADRLGSTIAQPVHALSYPEVGEKGQFCAQLLADRFGKKVIPNRIHSINQSPYLIDQVNYYLKDIFPGVEIEAQSSWNMQSAQVLIRNSVKKSFGASTNVGFGISYLLPIIVTGLIAAEGSIMIVENPEAHLHPAAQSKVGKFLAMVADSGVKVVVETHSDHLINGIQYYAVAHPDFSPKVIINNFGIAQDPKTKQAKVKIQPIRLSDNGDYTNWPDGFMDQSRKDLFDLYQLRMNMQNH